MKKLVGKLISAVMVTVLVASVLAGCAGGAGKEGEAQGQSGGSGGTETIPMGRYVEEEIELPEGARTVLDITKMEDGTLQMVTLSDKEEEPAKRWISSDGGATWEVGKEFPEEIRGQYFLGYSTTPGGEAVVVAFQNNNASGEYNLYAIDKEGSATKLEPELPELVRDENSEDISGIDSGEAENPEAENQEGASAEESGSTEIVSADFEMFNGIHSALISADGRIFAIDFQGNLYCINSQDGSIEKTYQEEGVSSIAVTNEYIIAINHEGGAQIYDLTTGDPVSDQTFSEAITTGTASAGIAFGSQVLIRQGDQENTLYYSNSNGLFRHVVGGTVAEQIIDGALATIGSPGISLQCMEIVSDEEILFAVMDSQGMVKLLRYVYSKDTPARPSKEITVYSLYSNDDIRQAIATFQQTNSEYYVNFQVGMTGEDGITEADALRTLNTDIMAGNGPDVILLDGMPMDSYIEKGLLADITDVFNQIKESDGVFENVTDTYEKEGSYYVLPLRFKVPAIQGDHDTVATANDLDAFVSRIEKLRQEKPECKQIVSSASAELLARYTYDSYSSAMQKEDGSIDREKLLKYYKGMQRLMATDQSAQELIDQMMVQSGDDFYLSIFGGALQMLSRELQVNLGELGSIDDYNTITSVGKEIENSAVDLLEIAGNKTFVPSSQVGVNSKSEKKEDARVFISYLLGQEAQKNNQGGGFPVNKTAFTESTIKGDNAIEYSYMASSEDGVMVQLEVKWSSPEEFANLQAMLESADTPAVTDSIIKTTILEQASACMKGDKTADEAADTVIQTINLYLAEQ